MRERRSRIQTGGAIAPVALRRISRATKVETARIRNSASATRNPVSTVRMAEASIENRRERQERRSRGSRGRVEADNRRKQQQMNGGKQSGVQGRVGRAPGRIPRRRTKGRREKTESKPARATWPRARTAPDHGRARGESPYRPGQRAARRWIADYLPVETMAYTPVNRGKRAIFRNSVAPPEGAARRGVRRKTWRPYDANTGAGRRGSADANALTTGASAGGHSGPGGLARSNGFAV